MEDQFRELISSQWTRGVTQEVFMNWHRIEASWKQLKDKTIFLWERSRRDDRNALNCSG
jgi:hypothetical protein